MKLPIFTKQFPTAAALKGSVFSPKIALAIKACACAFVICFCMTMTQFDAQARDISDRVVRLHIIANSDSKEDQALKLKVRDKVQRMCRDTLSSCKTKEQAEAALQALLPDIINEAQNTVFSEGKSDCVGGELVNMYFTNRDYGEFTLPAGNYDALRLTIGNAEGHNWWCVMFPPVCVSAAADFSDVLTDSETEVISQPENIEYKFKLYEAYCELKEIWSGSSQN